MERDLENLYNIYQKMSINESNEFVPKVKKGEDVSVKLMFFQGQPVSTVTAYDNSAFSDYSKTETFSFLLGGDMMMIAKWDGEKWISN